METKDIITRNIVGTGLKMNIHIEPIGDLHLSDYDFRCIFHTSSRQYGVTINKSEMQRVDADNYIAAVDTSELVAGTLKVRIYAEIPDDSFVTGIRYEIADFITDEILY